MTNILVVFTGGTIGSTAINGTINTSQTQSYQLIQLFQKRFNPAETIHFKTVQPLQLLSENLFPLAWETLINAIEAENLSNYDGVIVTHGTDTLAYTAAALALYFNSIKIPLLLVSSNYPLESSQANGLMNFNCAVEFIKQRKEVGVFVPYKNPDSEMLVHLGARLSSCLQLSGDFISAQFKAYLQFEQGGFNQINSIKASSCTSYQLKASFSKSCLFIRPYPGLDYSQFKLDGVDVVIHDLYHSGTACSSSDWGENHSLPVFIKKCRQLNISFYMAPAIKNTDAYHSTRILIEQGAKMIWNMSIESAYVKLLLAYGNFSDELSIEQFLDKNIAFEQIECPIIPPTY